MRSVSDRSPARNPRSPVSTVLAVDICRLEVRRCEAGLRLLRQAAGDDALRAAATARRPRPRHRRRSSVWRRDFRHVPRRIEDRPPSGRSRNRPDRDQDLSKDRAPCSSPKEFTLARRGIPSRHDQPGRRVNRLLDDQRQDSAAIGATDEQSALAGGSTARVAHKDMGIARDLACIVRSDAASPELVDSRLRRKQLIDEIGHARSMTSAWDVPVRRFRTTSIDPAKTEREGFEPSNEVDPRYAISSRARSTAPAPLQQAAAAKKATTRAPAARARATTSRHPPLLGSAQWFSR